MAKDFPPINLDRSATPNIREIQRRIQGLEDDLRRYKQSQGNGANSATSTMATLSSQVRDLQQITSDLQKATDELESVTTILQAQANVQYAEWTNASGVTGFTGWYSKTVASVQLSSPTGRIEVGFGGSLNNGGGLFCYSVTGASSGAIVDRNTVQKNYAQRVALSGGASVVGSAFSSVVVSVPKNEVLTITAELYALDNMVYFFGTRLLARATP